VAAPRLWLVRHGQTAWSAAGRHTGRTDLPLDDAGRAQALALRPTLQPQDFAKVLTSPLQRASETCGIAGYADAAQPDDDLQEWDYGDYEGLTTDEIRADRPGWTLWRDGCPGGETPEQVGARLDRVLARAEAAARGDGDVALVAHGHSLRVAGARWIALAPSYGGVLALDTATLSVLGHEHGGRVIRRWNSPG